MDRLLILGRKVAPQMRVFVSSTYRQLASYREVMRLAIEKSGHTFLGMEYFSAQDEPPLNVCLQELETADIYVGVLGTLYGSSPPGQELSYTELEYNRARELAKPCIILVISEEALIPVGSFDSDPNRNGRLRDFQNSCDGEPHHRPILQRTRGGLESACSAKSSRN